MKIKCHAIADGRVQGVGFRYFVLRAANELNIGGWVKNLYNGSVELYLHGEESDVDKLLYKIREGTMWIQVESLTVNRLDNDSNPDEREFSVKY